MKYIDTNTTVRLRNLIISGDISDKTEITIYTNDGKFLCRGKWYEDKVLEYGECFGKAHKAGTGVSVQFRLAD